MRLGRLQTALCAMLAAAPAARAADKVTYILDWLPSGEETFPYIALHEGLFAREGLEVTIQVGRGSSDVITKLAGGNAQFGSGGIGSLMAAAAQNHDTGGIPVKAVLSVFNTPPDAIFAIKGGPVTSLQSLKGLRVATATFTSSNVLWPVVARAAGLDPAGVTLVKSDPTALAPLLASGRVDALINWVTSSPGIEDVVKQAGKQMVTFPWTDAGLSGYGLSLFASDKVIREQPDVVARFTRAYAAAVQMSIKDCRLGAADLHAEVPGAEADTAEEECKTTIPLIRNAISERDGFGTFAPGLLRATWDWAAKSQEFKPDQIDPDAIVNRSFMPHT